MRILAVTNMYPTPRVPEAGIFVEQQIRGLRQIGLEVEMTFVDRVRKGMAVYLGLGPKVRTKIKHFRPHIVHAMYGGVMADAVTKAVTYTPTVVTFHGSDLLGEHLSGFVRKLIADYGVQASRRAAQRADGVVVVSRVLQEVLPKSVDRSKVRIIPCGIDLDRFKPLEQNMCRERLGWDPHCFHILFYSSRNPVKRPALARGAVEALKSLGVHAELHQLHGASNNDVPIWLNASDVVLLTSLHEGSPTIVKEALACNVPVVSVDVGDVRSRIERIEGCYIALPEANDLAAKLRLVRASVRRVAGRVRMQELSLEQVALRLKEFYGEILASDGKDEQRVSLPCRDESASTPNGLI